MAQSRTGIALGGRLTPYAEMGYYDPDYEPKPTDILAASASAAAASSRSKPRRRSRASRRPRRGRSSGPTASRHAHYQAKAYAWIRCRPRQRVHRAHRLRIDLFEEGSIAELTSSIIGNVFGSALRALRSRLRIAALREDVPGPPHGVVMEREMSTSSAGRYSRDGQAEARALVEELRAVSTSAARRLDFTKDDENINSQPFMRWRDRSSTRSRA